MQTPPSLLECTYIHAQGIGRVTEKRLWDTGIRTWQDYLADQKNLPLSSPQRALLTPIVEESIERLAAEDFAWFRERLPAGEHWRAVPSFGHRLAFLDIETNGGMRPTDLTVVGVYDGCNLKQYVKGQNLEQFPESLDEAAIIVTFFGTGFDIPFIRRAYPRLPLPQMHVDLCFVLKRLGFKGGLKSIEQQLGIERQNATRGLSGWDAVRLWREYRAGHEKSLEILLAYNADDVRNMSDLLAEAYRRMSHHVLTE